MDSHTQLVGRELGQRRRHRQAAGSPADPTATEIVGDIGRCGDPHTAIIRLMQRASVAALADEVAACLIDDDSVRIVGSSPPDATGARFPRSEFAWITDVVERQHRRLIHSGEAAVPPAFAHARNQGSYVLLMPLGRPDTRGALIVTRRTAFTVEDEEILDLFGGLAGMVLDWLRLAERIQSVESAKTAFLNMAAHELRTPLSVMRGYLAVLCDGGLGNVPDHWRRPLEVLDAKASEMAQIVDALLAAARLRGQQGDVATTRLDLRDLAAAATARAAARADLVSAALSIELPNRAVPVEVNGAQIACVLDNLLNNALTYATDRPRVNVQVEARPQPRVLVADAGIGIDPAQRDRVFEYFQRVGAPDGRVRPGTGLGLPIARELAVRNGGSVSLLDSVVGKGSTFVLELPTAGGGDAE